MTKDVDPATDPTHHTIPGTTQFFDESPTDPNLSTVSDNPESFDMKSIDEKAVNPVSLSMVVFFQSSIVINEVFFHLLAVTRGATGVVQGLIVALPQLASALLQPCWGWFSDKYGRKWLLFIGTSVLMLCSLLIPFFVSPISLLFLITIQFAFAHMVGPIFNAWVTDRSTKLKRGRIFGLFGLVGSWSSLTAYILVGSIMQLIDPNRENISTFYIPFFVSAGFAVLALLLIPFLSGKYPKSVNPPQRLIHAGAVSRSFFKRINDEWSETKRIFSQTLGGRKFSRFLIIEGIFTITWSFGWPLFSYAILDTTQSWTQLIFLEICFSISFGAFNILGGNLVDRFGKKRIIILSRIFLVIPPLATAGTIFFGYLEFLYISELLTGMSIGAGNIAIASLISDFAPEDARARFFSAHVFVFSTVGFFGSLAMGILLQLLIGSARPSTVLVGQLFIIVAILRCITWFGYLFTQDTVSLDSE